MLRQGTAQRRAARALAMAIEQPTLASGPDEPFSRLHTLLRELFPSLFSHAQCEIIKGRAMLLSLPGAGDAQPLVFLSHLDVAPIRLPDRWTFPPFSGELHDGYVYGRGAADMKGHLIALLTAAESLLESGVHPRSDIYFAFSCDEEIRGDSMQRLRALLQARGVSPAFVLDEGGAVTELPTLCEKRTALIGVSEKGRMCFTLTADGERSTETLLRAAERLLRLRFTPRICPATGMMLSALADEMRGVTRFCALHPRALQRPLLRRLDRTVYGRSLTRTQMSVSALRGDALRGERAAISFQASILPGDEARALLERIRRVIGDDRVLVTVNVMDEPSVISPAAGPAWDALTTAIQVHFPGVKTVPYMLNGSSDARRMEALCPFVYRFSPFILPPEEMARMHGVDERLSVENLLRGVDFFRQMLMA